MKVSKVGTAKETSASKKKKTSGAVDGVFAETLKGAGTVSEPIQVSDSAAIGDVGAILAAQEVPDGTDGQSRRILHQYGDDLLGRLDEIRFGILAGAYSKEKLADLAQRIRQKKQQSDDPRLNEIIDEIELRAEVEIAKLTRGV